MYAIRSYYGILFFWFLQGTVVSAQDWPNLERFREANEVLKKGPVDNERVVFMGNSITENWIKTYPDYFTGHFVNRGISGQVTPHRITSYNVCYTKLLRRCSRVVILIGSTTLILNGSMMVFIE